MKKAFCFLLYALVLGLFSTCVASESRLYNSILRIEGNNVYVKHDGVEINKKGIFIYVEGQLVPIYNLEQNGEDLYFSYDKNYAWELPPLCPLCNSPWVITWCSNPNCPANQ